MAKLPDCPNVRTGQCARSQLIIAEENPKWFRFHCLTCELDWVWSRPKLQEQASYERHLSQIREATERDRVQREQGVVFHAPRGGWK